MLFPHNNYTLQILKSTDTAAEAGAPDTESATTADVEPFNVRRGGRGRGRKGPTPKESAQVHTVVWIVILNPFTAKI